MSVFHNNALIGSGAGTAAAAAGPIKSLRFNETDNAYLSRTPASAGSRKTWTYSTWVKVNRVAYNNLFSNLVNNDNGLYVFWSGSRFYVQDSSLSGGASVYTERTHFRDFSAWMHIVISYDTTQATASDRVRIYINGVQETLEGTQPNQNIDGYWNSTETCLIGRQDLNVSLYDYNGYMADIYFIDGSALDASSFGAYDANGVWQAATYSGTYGTNGFHLLDFANESTVGHDSSGNGNDFTATNISTTAGAGNDVLFDVPTNGTQSDTGAGGEVSGNYATLNSLDSQGSLTLSNGNLDVSNTANSLRNSRATIAYPATGKWYYEYTPGGSANMAIGIADSTTSLSAENNGTFITYHQDGAKNVNGTKTASAFASYTAGDVIGVMYDSGSNSVTFYKNNSSQGSVTPTSGTTYFPFIITYNTTGSFNFGARAFAYTAPSSAKALCTTNLPTPTIADGSDYFEAKTYTGNGSTQTISLPFSPDLVWVKGRSTSNDHELATTVQPANKALASNIADAEFNTVIEPGTNSFFLDGTSIYANENNATYISWNWNAGSSTASNTDGSITSSVRASQTSGFSVVSYTGSGSNATVGHGLNAALDFIIIKDRDAGQDWAVWHTGLPTPTTGFMSLNLQDSQSNSAAYWNSTVPTNSVFSLGTAAAVNTNGNDYIAYCFSEVKSYSAFGVYRGNGSTDGPFVHLGFKPAFILLKSYGNVTNWLIYDTARDTSNVSRKPLVPNNSLAETGNEFDALDIVSNGFKIRNTSSSFNQSTSYTYIYAAFAEHPFQANGGLAR